MVIKSVLDSDFSDYGRVIKGYDLTQLFEKMEDTPLPEDVVYVPSCSELETLAVHNEFKERLYGGLPVQTGYCNGHNDKLNALEYHRSSEINAAVTDLILLLGKQQDIADDFTYDTSNAEAFFVPEGVMVELYATTLHYAPCGVNGAGFKCIVVLPKGTNYEIAGLTAKAGTIEDITNMKKSGDDSCEACEDMLLAAANKWLIAHEDAHIAGAYNGLKGVNISLRNGD